MEAEAAYEQAIEMLPGHIPATAGLARIHEAEGRRAEAITLLEAATARLPQPELVAALGDLYALAGDAAAAERQYALVERIGAVGTAGGSVYDRQLILFAADHDRDVATAVQAAEAALRTEVTSMLMTRWPGPCSRPGVSTRRPRRRSGRWLSGLQTHGWRTTPG